MFLLNQSDLPFASGGFLKVITFQPCVCVGCDFTDRVHLQQALRVNADPFDLALLGNTGELLPLKGFAVAHGSMFVSVIRQFPYLLRFRLYTEF